MENQKWKEMNTKATNKKMCPCTGRYTSPGKLHLLKLSELI